MRNGAPLRRRRRAQLAFALVFASVAACVSPKHPEPPRNERDPAEVRAEQRLQGAGGFLNAVAGFARAKS